MSEPTRQFARHSANVSGTEPGPDASVDWGDETRSQHGQLPGETEPWDSDSNVSDTNVSASATEAPDRAITEELPQQDTAPQPAAEDPPAKAVDDPEAWVRPITDDDPGTRPARKNPAGVGMWLGIALVAVGFAAIFMAWNQVAGLTNVAEQVPFLISGGLAGLALVIVGATAVDVSVRRQDSRERKRQLRLMNRTLAEVRELMETDAYDNDEPAEPADTNATTHA